MFSEPRKQARWGLYSINVQLHAWCCWSPKTIWLPTTDMCEFMPTLTRVAFNLIQHGRRNVWNIVGARCKVQDPTLLIALQLNNSKIIKTISSCDETTIWCFWVFVITVLWYWPQFCKILFIKQLVFCDSVMKKVFLFQNVVGAEHIASPTGRILWVQLHPLHPWLLRHSHGPMVIQGNEAVGMLAVGSIYAHSMHDIQCFTYMAYDVNFVMLHVFLRETPFASFCYRWADSDSYSALCVEIHYRMPLISNSVLTKGM